MSEQRNLKDVVFQVCKRYLEIKGYNILNTNYDTPAGTIDFVVEDGSTLFFCYMTISIDVRNGFEDLKNRGITRSVLEKQAAWYLAHNDHDSCTIRFDALDMLAVNNSRGFLRHHLDIVNAPEFQ